MTVYCDTSVLVSAFAAEANSTIVRTWLESQGDTLAISEWVVTEFSGAFAMKRRMGLLDHAAWQRVLATWQAFKSGGVLIELVGSRDFAAATALLERADLKLRAGDALHIALAKDRGFAVATLDHEFAAAAATLHLTVDRVVS